MNEPVADHRAQLRQHVYWLLIFVSVGVMLGRIFAVDSVDKVRLESYLLATKVPSDLQKKRSQLEAQGLSGEALKKELAKAEVQLRRKAVQRRPFLSANDRSRWCTVRALVEDDMRVEGIPYAIDKVIQEPNWDTIDMVKFDGHLYSSKPPLLATVMAAVYWPIHRVTGVTLGTHPYEIDRMMLVLFNVVPLVIGFVLLARLVERFGMSDWGRIFIMASATFGTFLTTFAVTINNHVPAAVCTIATVYAVVRIWFDGERRLRYFFATGFFGALAITNDLPAASLFAAAAVLLVWLSPRATSLAFVPAAILVMVPFFGTNWIAFHSLKPAYLHRSEPGGWYDYDYERDGKKIESYWRHPVGVDRGESSRIRYAENVLVGHHGIFSLTPIWILSVLGAIRWMCHHHDRRLQWLAAGIAAISLACLIFYLGQPMINRNYGGISCGLRWMFWLAPLWLLTMIPMADALAARRWSRGMGLIMLLISAISASYPTWNPWTHPWLVVLSQYLAS